MPYQFGNQTYYSPEEVGIVIGRSYDTVLRHIRQKKIKALEAGGGYFISHDVLTGYLSEMDLPESIIEYRLKKKVERVE